MLLRWGRLLGTIGRGGSIGQGRMHCCKDSPQEQPRKGQSEASDFSTDGQLDGRHLPARCFPLCALHHICQYGHAANVTLVTKCGD